MALATHCVTDSPELCPASCSPAGCGWARQSRGSPSSPRTGTRWTAALDISKHKNTVFGWGAESITDNGWICKQVWPNALKIRTEKTVIWFVNITDWCTFVQTGLCELVQDGEKWKHSRKVNMSLSEAQSALDGGQGTVSVSLFD